jgi:hypothetical protein
MAREECDLIFLLQTAKEPVMRRREWLTATGALTLAAAGADVLAAPKQNKTVHSHASACCNECAACAVECAACAGHCAARLADGERAHAATLALCNDCSDLCSTCAKIGARSGPFAALVCRACAEACDRCAAACAKFNDDQQMSQCAKRCRECAEACREMIKQLDSD